MLAADARRDSELCGSDEPKYFEQGPAQWPARPVLFHWKDWEALNDSYRSGGEVLSALLYVFGMMWLWFLILTAGMNL
jgi:hypothetical protein